MNIKNFENFLLNEDKKSINLDDIMKYGGVKINQELKRTRYRYVAVFSGLGKAGSTKCKLLLRPRYSRNNKTKIDKTVGIAITLKNPMAVYP